MAGSRLHWDVPGPSPARLETAVPTIEKLRYAVV